MLGEGGTLNRGGGGAHNIHPVNLFVTVRVPRESFSCFNFAFELVLNLLMAESVADDVDGTRTMKASFKAITASSSLN